MKRQGNVIFSQKFLQLYHQFLWISTVNSNATLSSCRSIVRADKRINLHPDKRENRCQQNRPQNNNSWGSVLSSHKSLEERIEMQNDPKRKENLSKQGPPCFIPTIECVGESSNHSDQVHNENGCWRDQNCRPFDHIELSKFSVIGCFGCHCEVGIKPC